MIVDFPEFEPFELLDLDLEPLSIDYEALTFEIEPLSIIELPVCETIQFETFEIDFSFS